MQRWFSSTAFEVKAWMSNYIPYEAIGNALSMAWSVLFSVSEKGPTFLNVTPLDAQIATSIDMKCTVIVSLTATTANVN